MLPIIFYINNSIIKEDYDQFLVDEKYILIIIVNTFENKKEHLQEPKENIEESKEIRIRD